MLAPVIMWWVMTSVCVYSCSTYEWQDSKNKKHVKLPAKQYIDSVLSNIQKQLCEESIFPTKFGKNLLSQCVLQSVVYCNNISYYMICEKRPHKLQAIILVM